MQRRCIKDKPKKPSLRKVGIAAQPSIQASIQSLFGRVLDQMDALLLELLVLRGRVRHGIGFCEFQLLFYRLLHWHAKAGQPSSTKKAIWLVHGIRGYYPLTPAFGHITKELSL